ncbi:MAG: restriction endonuclease subunit S [Pseudomonadota bacterium]
MTTIGEVAEIFDGPHATPEKTETGPYFLSISSLEEGRLDLTKSAHLGETDFKKWTKRVTPKKGDLLFSYETRLGEVALMPDGIRACLGRRMGLLRPKKDKVISEYLLYAYLSPSFQQTIISNTIRGATVDRLALNEFPDFSIRIPCIEEQEKVANLLQAIDAKIDCNKRINAELEAMAKTLYDYWFVQFEFPDAKGKPYKSSGGKMVYNATLKREIPTGWEDGMASDLFDFNPSLSLSINTEASYIDMSSLPVTGFMTNAPERKVFAGGMKFQNGDVVVARITPCLENGKTALISLLKDSEVGFGSTEFIVLRGKKTPLSAFATQLSRSVSFRQFAISNMTGTSGRKRIDASTLETFSLPLPPEDLLLKYEKTARACFERMTNNAQENQQLAKLRDWLLPMLMNGQVTVA